MDSIQEIVLRRARELNRFKAGNASETASYVDLEGENPDHNRSSLIQTRETPDT
ncbi:hypothetical protein DPMN_094045 [Dreissena polymorpha]|uniref:Uncharacterized protein n=1 Tax=Dreissena polymorpha TaxID=45954 RepID=A0A9D4R2B2_DREPO|nr:hypothetical protein DPMN_094045 [Dreissena polymorpha]